MGTGKIMMSPNHADDATKLTIHSGCLIWVTSCTLPHLCVATTVLSRFSLNPSERNFAALIRVLLYIRKHR